MRKKRMVPLQRMSSCQPFQLSHYQFLNAQNVYYILDDGDKQEKSQMLQEKDTVSLEIKEYISRQEAAELAGVYRQLPNGCSQENSSVSEPERF